MDEQKLQQALDDIQVEDGTIKPIPSGSGLISYRKYLWALYYKTRKLEQLEDYKAQVVAEIEKDIDEQRGVIGMIRSSIEYALETDPIAENTKTGGRKISLPDIGTASISKITDKIIIEDPEKVLQELGNEYEKQVKPSLDTTKAKKYLETVKELPDGVRTEKSRTLSIRFIK
jgi:hypothetical protein